MESQALRTITFPFQGGRVILPNSAAAEVLPFARPLRMENAPPWVVGSILWKTMPIPIISLERLVLRTNPGVGAHSRIIIVNALGNDPKLREFGFLSTEPPQLVDMQRADIHRYETPEPNLPGVACRVLFRNQQAIIPDMPAIEAVLSRLVRV